MPSVRSRPTFLLLVIGVVIASAAPPHKSHRKYAGSHTSRHSDANGRHRRVARKKSKAKKRRSSLSTETLIHKFVNESAPHHHTAMDRGSSRRRRWWENEEYIDDFKKKTGALLKWMEALKDKVEDVVDWAKQEESSATPPEDFDELQTDIANALKGNGDEVLDAALETWKAKMNTHDTTWTDRTNVIDSEEDMLVEVSDEAEGTKYKDIFSFLLDYYKERIAQLNSGLTRSNMQLRDNGIVSVIADYRKTEVPEEDVPEGETTHTYTFKVYGSDEMIYISNIYKEDKEKEEEVLQQGKGEVVGHVYYHASMEITDPYACSEALHASDGEEKDEKYRILKAKCNLDEGAEPDKVGEEKKFEYLPDLLPNEMRTFLAQAKADEDSIKGIMQKIETQIFDTIKENRVIPEEGLLLPTKEE